MEKSHTPLLRRFCLMLALTILCLVSRANDLKKFFTPEQIVKANTGKDAGFMNDKEKKTLTVINLARLYPRQFLKFYMDYAGPSAVSGNTYYTTLTKELKEMDARGALMPDKDMYDLAKCWATEAGKEGVVGHERKNCDGWISAECCSYGSGSGIGVAMQLLIDDGVKSLGHRKICLSEEYKRVGICMQPHKIYGVNTVLDFERDPNYNPYMSNLAKSKKQKIGYRNAKNKTGKRTFTVRKTSKTKVAVKSSGDKRSKTNSFSKSIATKKSVIKKPTKQTAKNKSGQKASAKQQLAKN
jgi:hypothetical protein